ncbi:MAG: TIGR03013 family PEP-CTERM/XrtA system glycosyltransferase [Candidatus Electrothrix sp. AX5]|nr:TIGR03013 family PEP-CTERM/XrtA system glycosyltransferase [Candidatus Electrothrix sp. AX5]
MLSLLTKGNLIRYQFVLVSGDVLIALGIFLVSHNFFPSQLDSLEGEIFIIPVLLMMSYMCGRYQTATPFNFKILFFSFLVILIGVFLHLIYSVDQAVAYPKVPVISLISFFLLQAGWHRLVHDLYKSRLLKQNIIVLGTGPIAEKVERLIQGDSDHYSLLGFISTPKDLVTVPQDKIVGSIENIVDIATGKAGEANSKANSIIIALTEKRGNPFMDQLISCKLNGIRIIEYPSFYEMLTGKIPIEDINPSWLVQSNGFLITPFLRRVKRCLDIIAASFLLIIISPFILPIILIIKWVSPGPVIYEQERVGLHGESFIIYKFRSMNVDAEKETGPVMNSSSDDDRTFPFGAFMRKTRIDELPQLINVLKGDMSFIGPRPERPAFVRQINEQTRFYNERHAIKPGITGWAQVMFRYGSNIGDSIEKLRYDLYYINNMSLVLDLVIVLETIKVVLFRKGSL